MLIIIGGMSRNIPANVFKDGTYRQIDVDAANSASLPSNAKVVFAFKKFISHTAYNRFKDMSNCLGIPFVVARGGINALISAAQDQGVDLTPYLKEKTVAEPTPETNIETKPAFTLPDWATDALRGSYPIHDVEGHGAVKAMTNRHGKVILFRGWLLKDTINRIRMIVKDINNPSDITDEICQLAMEDIAEEYFLPITEYHLPHVKSLKDTVMAVLGFKLKSTTHPVKEEVMPLATVNGIKIYGQKSPGGMYNIILNGERGEDIVNEIIKYASEKKWAAISKNGAAEIAAYLNVKLGVAAMKNVNQIPKSVIYKMFISGKIAMPKIENFDPIPEQPICQNIPDEKPEIKALTEIVQEEKTITKSKPTTFTIDMVSLECKQCVIFKEEIERLRKIIKGLQATLSSLMGVNELGK